MIAGRHYTFSEIPQDVVLQLLLRLAPPFYASGNWCHWTAADHYNPLSVRIQLVQDNSASDSFLCWAPPVMQSFTFITNSDGASGKVASQQTRTVIRAHVMRKHWTEKPSPTKFVSARCKLRQQIGDGHTHRTSIGKQAKTMNDATHSSQETHKETIDQSPPSPVSTASSASSEDTIVSRHLNRTTDAFVYAGSSIDVKSYGYFHHYTLECMSPQFFNISVLLIISKSTMLFLLQSSPCRLARQAHAL